MRSRAILPFVLLFSFYATARSAEPAAGKTEENAVRAVIDEFSNAYNAHDAKTLATLFADNGEIGDSAGKLAQGRDAIEHAFAEIFRQHPKAKIAVTVESLRLLGPSLAMEDGRTIVRGLSGGEIECNRYAVVHVKQDGRWLMASARDLPDSDASAVEQIQQFDWLIGQWIHETPDALVVTTYRWNEAHSAILVDFRIQVGGRPTMTGMQRIGWDPSSRAIHSWVFDSDGGVAEGVYTRDGNRWLIKTTGATRDGRAVSATNVVTKVSSHRMKWLSRDRVVGDEVLPDIAEVTIVRMPPQPAAASAGNSTGASK